MFLINVVALLMHINYANFQETRKIRFGKSPKSKKISVKCLFRLTESAEKLRYCSLRIA